MQNSRGIPPFQITRVWARNFRSMAKTEAALDRLTVLVGPNASGKSHVLDILRFVKDALRFDLETAISLRHGFEAIQHQAAVGQVADIELGLEARADESYHLVYSFTLVGDPDGGFRVRQERAEVWQDTRDKSVEFRIEEGTLKAPEWLTADEATSDFGTSDLCLLWWPRRVMPRKFGGSELLQDGTGSGKREYALWQVARTLDRFRRRMRESRFYHIFPNTLREPRKLRHTYPLNEDAGNLASVLRTMQRSESGGIPHFRDALQHLIPGVADWDVIPAGGYLVVCLKHEGGLGEACFDLSQEADGTIRLLGLLVALYQRPHLPLMGMEEPELNVHPGALAILADLLNEASRRSQVIVTTHSTDLIDCLTDYRAIESLRIVERRAGATVVGRVSHTQVEAVRQRLFSPGELHRMGELELPHGEAHA